MTANDCISNFATKCSHDCIWLHLTAFDCTFYEKCNQMQPFLNGCKWLHLVAKNAVKCSHFPKNECIWLHLTAKNAVIFLGAVDGFYPKTKFSITKHLKTPLKIKLKTSKNYCVECTSYFSFIDNYLSTYKNLSV